MFIFGEYVVTIISVTNLVGLEPDSEVMSQLGTGMR